LSGWGRAALSSKLFALISAQHAKFLEKCQEMDTEHQGKLTTLVALHGNTLVELSRSSASPAAVPSNPSPWNAFSCPAAVKEFLIVLRRGWNRNALAVLDACLSQPTAS